METRVFYSDHLGKGAYCEFMRPEPGWGANGCAELYRATEGAQEDIHFFYTFSDWVK